MIAIKKFNWSKCHCTVVCLYAGDTEETSVNGLALIKYISMYTYIYINNVPLPPPLPLALVSSKEMANMTIRIRIFVVRRIFISIIYIKI